MAEQNLQGGCSCGRNQYEIVIPSSNEARSTAQVLLGETTEIRRSHGSPLPVLLRIPLLWLQSTTYAYTKDERPADIRRVFSPYSEPQSKRNFCGFCGTQLTYWTEGHPEEAEFICVNMGSLERDSVSLLDDFGLLPIADRGAPDNSGDDSIEPPAIAQSTMSAGHRLIRSDSWLETLVRTGSLGDLRRRRGMRRSRDDHSLVEWEFIEVGAIEDAETPKKRQMTGAVTDDEAGNTQE